MAATARTVERREIIMATTIGAYDPIEIKRNTNGAEVRA